MSALDTAVSARRVLDDAVKADLAQLRADITARSAAVAAELAAGGQPQNESTLNRLVTSDAASYRATSGVMVTTYQIPLSIPASVRTDR